LPARITDNGLGCELWVENNVACGAATGSMTAAYLDSAGNSKSGVIATVVSAPVAGQMQPVPLENSLGVKQLTSVTNSNTWTSGTWGMTILKRIASIALPLNGTGDIMDWAKTGLPLIPDDACIMAFIQASTTTGPIIVGATHLLDI
jgi:hypothetical protein